ncbi:MBL fold metallo-hydrolase [Seongchinamella sediminis]|uniref:MBL fold metallo-hydrolase n=1 Tax=Seongchinamella sediminis TaxID=2283635 RepID=A0A3L7DY88_9GAMM|nr:MBL fold metallo-hydrolase [Seongchinamella sediminis]RLQ21609.1 MBL fold metallo-hydrolase [Seongchinamella sediminis]
MAPPVTEDLGFGITRIDTGYLEPGVASFYLVQSGRECAVVETGTIYSVPALLQLLQALAISPGQVRYVIPTHVHLDHAGGAGAMMRHFPEAELVVHPRGARHLIDPGKLVAASRQVFGDARFASQYGDVVPVPESRVRAAEDGLCLELAGRRLQLRHTPGHADHHLCVWDQQSQGWFSGDVFGISYQWLRTPGGDFCMPTTTPSQFRPEALKSSINLLAAASPARIYLTHYGELAYSDRVRQSLLRQIDDYVGLAIEYSGQPQQLEEAIIDYSLQCVQAMNPTMEVAGMREMFRHDAQLNSQGLSHWQQRQSA